MFGTAKRRNEIRTETACHTISIEACVSQKLGGRPDHA
jgi:hypothetical protein